MIIAVCDFKTVPQNVMPEILFIEDRLIEADMSKPLGIPDDDVPWETDWAKYLNLVAEFLNKKYGCKVHRFSLDSLWHCLYDYWLNCVVCFYTSGLSEDDKQRQFLAWKKELQDAGKYFS